MQQQFPNQQEFYSDFDFTNAKLLGQGTFGKVYKAESKGITSLAKGQYAIKIIETHSEQAYSLALCELNLNQIIHYHTNVITIYKVYSWMEHGPLQKYMFAIVMELGLNSLKSELDNRREMKRIYEDALIIDIMNQCLTTFDYLARDKSLYHRDIKPENILITNYKPFTVKIADFGAGKETLTENAMMNTLVGTPLFLSPKLWVAFQQNATGKVKHHLEKSDVFSLGLTFLQTILLLTDRELMKLNDPIIYETNGDAVDCSDNDMLLSKCPGWNKLQAHIKSIQNPIIGSCIYGMTHFSEKKRFTWLQALNTLNTDYQDPLQQEFISLEQTMNQNQQQFEVSKPLKTYKNEQIQLRYHGANLNLPKSNYFLSAGTQIVAWNNEGLKIIGITGTSQTLYDSQVLHVAYLQQLQILVGINSYGEIFAINIRDKKVVSEKIPNSQFNPQQITVMKHMRKDMVLLGTIKGELIVLAFDQSTPQVVQKFKDHDQPIMDLIYDDQFKQVICYHQDQLIVLSILVQQSSTKIKTETPLSGLKLLSDEYFAGSSKTEPSIYVYHVFEGTITLVANINTHSFIPQSFISIGNYLVWNSDQVICALNYLSKIKQEQSLDLYVKLEHSNQQLIVCDGYLIIGCNSTEIHKYSVGKPVKSKEACACQLQ